ncbi:hypothetical protein GOV06_02055 [Candidatus Woesearchaeota archaeon]|nr:hypothetical protein [Candidatus Woesearchaeota archaeon]
MIEEIAALAMIWIAISAVYLLKNKKTSPAQKHEYIWVGEGKNPFKK